MTVDVLQEILVGVFVVMVMLSVGLDLTFQRIARVFKRPQLIVVALLLNHAVMPLVAVGISDLLVLTPAVFMGLLLCAAAPGGPIGALLTQNARADLAFAASLVVVMTLLNTVTTPLTLRLLGPDNHLGNFNVTVTILKIAAFQLLPLSAGLVIRQRSEAKADRLQPVVGRLTKVVFAVMFIGMTATRAHLLGENGIEALIAIELSVLATVFLGFLLAPGQLPQRASLSLNSGIRNLGLCLLLATAWFDDDRAVLTVLSYGLLMLVNTVPLSFAYRRAIVRREVKSLRADQGVDEP